MKKLKSIIYKLLIILTCVVGVPVFLLSTMTLLFVAPVSMLFCSLMWIFYGKFNDEWRMENELMETEVTDWYELCVYAMEYIPGFTLYYILICLFNLQEKSKL